MSCLLGWYGALGVSLEWVHTLHIENDPSISSGRNPPPPLNTAKMSEAEAWAGLSIFPLSLLFRPAENLTPERIESALMPAQPESKALPGIQLVFEPVTVFKVWGYFSPHT